MDNRYNNIEEQEAISHLAPVPFDNNYQVGLGFGFGKLKFERVKRTGATKTIRELEKIKYLNNNEELCHLPHLVNVERSGPDGKRKGTIFQRDHHTCQFTVEDVAEWKLDMENHSYSLSQITKHEKELIEDQIRKDLLKSFNGLRNAHATNANEATQTAMTEAKTLLDNYENNYWRQFLTLKVQENKTAEERSRANIAEYTKKSVATFDKEINELKSKRYKAIRRDKCCVVAWLEYLLRQLCGAEHGFVWCTFYACIRTIWFFALFVIGPLAICYFLPGKFKPMGNEALDCVDKILAQCGMHELGIKFETKTGDQNSSVSELEQY